MKTQLKSTLMKIRIADLIMLALLATMITLSSCSSDDDEAKPDTRPQFIGTYAVEDESASSKYVYHYDITISNGSGGEVNISNFADLFNVPVKGVIDGNKLTINSQTFKNPSGNEIKVSGAGTITGDVLNFTYTTTGYLDYTGTCKASKKTGN
jgi:hypothetical protein